MSDSETLQILAGQRGRKLAMQQAVRIADMQALFNADLADVSADADNPPTATEFNALRREVRALRAVIAELQQALSDKLR